MLNIDEQEKVIKLFEKYQDFLTQTQKQAFQLYYFENLSYSEIAEIMATTRTASYDAVKKAIKKLKSIEEKIN